MHTTDSSLALAPIDELTKLLLSVARRADELERSEREAHGGRDFWREAEAEILQRGLAAARSERRARRRQNHAGGGLKLGRLRRIGDGRVVVR